MSNKKLHIYSNRYGHGESYIVGTTEGLMALRDAIELALERGMSVGVCSVFDASGEGYEIVVQDTRALLGSSSSVAGEEYAWDHIALPYDTLALPARDTLHPVELLNDAQQKYIVEETIRQWKEDV